MTRANWQEDNGLPLLALGTSLLRNRWRIARWMICGVSVAALVVLPRPRMYRAMGSFVPQANEASRSGLASLAGQFGLTLPSGGQTFSSDFYAKLLNSRVLLRQVVLDTFTVREMEGRQEAFMDLFKIRGAIAGRREEQAVRALRKMIKISVSKTTGVVELFVLTRWPSVSAGIAAALLDGVNEFNQRTRQGQAAAERRFVESRLGLAAADLRAAEDRLEAFLRRNRQFSSSPELTFQEERLQRDVSLRQQMFTALTQSYEEVRIREVRDTPVITVVEAPSVPVLPQPRGRVLGLLLGFVLGGIAGVLASYTSQALALRQRAGDVEAEEFVHAVGDLRSEIAGRMQLLRKRIVG